MLGGIYSDQKCPVCGANFRDDRNKGLFCPKHPRISATHFEVIFRGVHRRFESYSRARHFLEGMRGRVEDKSFDPRDYRKDSPLGFTTLAEQYLEYRKGEIASYRQVKWHIEKAIKFFGEQNIKSIRYASLEDFLLCKNDRARALCGSMSAKTRANIKATLHAFWVWLRKRQVIQAHQVPEFPAVPFELGWRTIIDKDTQRGIIDEVQRIAPNPKIWIGIKWLATYIGIRPKEMLNIKEGDFDYQLGGVLIRKPKEKKPKFIPFLQEDMDLLSQFPPALPHLYFFRHNSGLGGVQVGAQFGKDFFYGWWKKACKNLSIEGVDLYGGTRHSSTTALRQHFSPEEIRRATVHRTNKAFDRYLMEGMEEMRLVYQKTAGKDLVKNLAPSERGKVLEITRKD